MSSNNPGSPSRPVDGEKSPAKAGGTARVVPSLLTSALGVGCSRMLLFGEFSTDGDSDGKDVRLWLSEPGPFGVFGVGRWRNEEFDRCVCGLTRTVLDRREVLGEEESRRGVGGTLLLVSILNTPYVP